jgi:restriction system protein
MTRQVLCRLNDAGESALATRREVLKRASEFEDFSSCWDNDRLKAQGLVTQIQKLVNVKDSFTRMNIERERKRKQRQAVYTTEMEAKQKKIRNARPSKKLFISCSRKRTRTSAEGNSKLC